MVVKQEIGITLKSVLALVALASGVFSLGTSWALQLASTNQLKKDFSRHEVDDGHISHHQQEKFISRTEFTGLLQTVKDIETRQRSILESQVRVEEQLKK